MTTTAATRRPVRRRLATTALAATTALLAAAPAASAIEWVQGPEIVSPRTYLSTAETAPDGTTTASWLEIPENLSDPGGLKLRQVAPDGTLLPVQTLEALILGEPSIDVAVSDNGAAVVVWTGLAVGSETPLRIASVGTGGALGPVRTVANISAGYGDGVRAAVDDNGTTTIVWTGDDPTSGDQGVMSMRVAADGTATVPLLLARTGIDAAPAVAVTPGGIAWVAWSDDDLDSNDVYAVRLGADARPQGAPEQVSNDEGTAVPPALSASAAGAVVSWLLPDGCCRGLTAAGRTLQTTGPLLGTSLRSRTVFEPAAEAPFAAAIGPDGTVSFVVPRSGDAGGGGVLPLASQPQLERFAPGAGSPTVTPLAPASGDSAVVSTAVGAGPDGSLLATWSEMTASLQTSLKGTRITPSGQVGPVVSSDGIGGFPLLPIPGLTGGQLPRPDLGGGTVLSIGLRLTTVEGTPIPLQTMRALTYDVTPPTVAIVAPASAVTAGAVQFSANVSDRTAVRLTWDFGDESESRAAAPRHRYAEAGTYTVTLTATDAAGNESVVRRQLTITPPAQPAPPRPAARAAAALKLTTASRRGASVTLAGTIASSASGRVTLVYAQRLGRRTIRATTTARIANGRWSTTLRLPRALARAPRRGATATVSYAGDADTAVGSAKRVVTTPKAKPKKPAKKPNTRG